MTSEKHREEKNGGGGNKPGLQYPKKRLCAAKRIGEQDNAEWEKVFANCIVHTCQYPDYIKETIQLKMGQRLEQTVLEGRHTPGQQLHEDAGLPTHQENTEAW